MKPQALQLRQVSELLRNVALCVFAHEKKARHVVDSVGTDRSTVEKNTSPVSKVYCIANTTGYFSQPTS